MKERPILFSAEMVRALLDGRKTQTRRVVKPQPIERNGQTLSGRHPCTIEKLYPEIRNRYGQPGDRLWVREAWRVGAWDNYEIAMAIDYLADNYAREEWLIVPDTMQDQFYRLREQSIDDAIGKKFFRDYHGDFHWSKGDSPCRGRPSIHMPRWASRIMLEITNVRVERAQEISEADAKAEGVEPSIVGSDFQDIQYRAGFQTLWDSINAKRGYGWEANPWVWVVEFKRIDG